MQRIQEKKVRRVKPFLVATTIGLATGVRLTTLPDRLTINSPTHRQLIDFVQREMDQ
jgi:hypothetical protein